MGARLLRWFDALIAAVMLIGWLVRCTVRDAWPLLATIFYALPWPVLAALGGWLCWRGRRLRLVWFGLSAAALLVWLSASWKFAPTSATRADLRVVQWNVARPAGRLPAIAAQLRALDADVITVAEAFPAHGATYELWRAEFPGYEVRFAKGDLLCLVRGNFVQQEGGWLGLGSFYSGFEVVVKGRPLSILQVDLIATPWRSRREPLDRIAQLAVARADRPLIVLGDFNTPRDSEHLAPMRRCLANAWEVAGRGCAETWPMPFPVLSLDHVWIGGGLRALRCEHAVSVRSDHRAVIVDLAWP